MKQRIFTIIVAMTAFAAVISAQVPDLTLHDINGKQVNIQKLCNSDKPVIISFFATWCKPCLRELNAIADVYDDWKEQTGVQLIAVSIDRAQDIEKVKPLADGNDWDYIVLLDADNELKRLMQVQTVPHLFIINGKGKIVEQRSGYTDGEEKQLLQKLKALK